MVETKLNVKKCFVLVADVYVFTLFAVVVLSALILQPILQLFEVNEQNSILFIAIVCCLIALLMVFLRIRHYQLYEKWKLEGSILSYGYRYAESIDINATKGAAIGLPQKHVKGVFFKYFTTAQMRTQNAVIDSAVVLKLDDTCFFPLYLYALPGGVEVMNGVYDVLNLKFSAPYQLNENERIALKKSKVNKKYCMK